MGGAPFPIHPRTTTHKFTGYERDAESGLDNAQARYSSSSLGRFMSPDPIGNFVADATNPQTWNMYTYVNNNPLAFVDPAGLQVEGGGPPLRSLPSWYDCQPQIFMRTTGNPFDAGTPYGPTDFFDTTSTFCGAGGDWGRRFVDGGGSRGGAKQINKMWSKTFSCNKSAQGVMSAVQNNMDDFARSRGTVFSADFPTQPIVMGGQYLIQPGLNTHNGGQAPMANLDVTVTSESASGWTFTTDPTHHFFNGTVSFSSTDAGDGNITFSVSVKADWVSPFTHYTIGPVILAGENSTWNNMLNSVQGYCRSPVN